jgi:nucleotide-binding universal stress UspA family protein
MASITHILVASDLTERSRPALHRALQLKQQLGADMTLLHVIEPGLPPAVTERRRQEALSVLREEINAAYRGELRRFSLDILVGERLATIIEHAGTRGADLIILGDTAKRRWKDLFVGTTTERVVRHSSQPVLVVSGPGSAPYKRALAAWDLSPGARLALEAALLIASEAHCRIVHAWQVPLIAEFAGKKAGERAVAEESHHVRALLEREIDNAKSRTPLLIAPEIRIVEGSPYFVIRDEMREYRPDLLAMGTHARSSLGTALVGSLARDLLTEASCDVLVARP